MSCNEVPIGKSSWPLGFEAFVDDLGRSHDLYTYRYCIGSTGFSLLRLCEEVLPLPEKHCRLACSVFGVSAVG